MKSTLIDNTKRLVAAKNRFGNYIPIYDDGFGPLFIHRDSTGISGIVRAQSWEDAYSICENEFFPSADSEATEKSYSALSEHEQACWNEAYGYRPNGIGGPTPKEDCGIYAKDLNGESLELLTAEFLAEWEITLEIESE